ncbi:MAG: PstS family phosphate ABC transporter substrate-binding protein [Gemmataceae bacterium]
MMRAGLGLFGLAVLLTLTGCPASNQEKPRGEQQIITADGSSTVYPVTEAAADEFQKKKPSIKVTVGNSGTGGGFKKFVRGETDISDASRPILQKEIDEAKKSGIEYIELPICFDALTVVVSKENTWVDHLTINELKTMWDPDTKSKITKWSDIRKGWPDEKFVLFGPGTDSGTFDYFTEAVSGKAGRSRDDYTASEDDNILVRGVSGNKNSLGYFGYAYYAAHKEKLRAVPILWEKGKVKTPVEPSRDAIIKGSYAPLSRPLFIYVNKKSLETRSDVKEFVAFYLENVGALARRKKYVELPKEAQDLCLKRFQQMQTGTGFGGHQEVGLSIEDILKREPK